jgi:hypothetical protein
MNAIYLGIYKGRLSYRRCLQPQKRTSTTSKLNISSSFSTFEGLICPPGYGSSRPKSMRIHADPDPKHWNNHIYSDFQTIYCRFSAIAETSESMFIGYCVSPGQVSDKSSPWHESNNLQQWGTVFK